MVTIILAVLLAVACILFIRQVYITMQVIDELTAAKHRILEWQVWHANLADQMRLVVEKATLDGADVNVLDGQGFKDVN